MFLWKPFFMVNWFPKFLSKQTGFDIYLFLSNFKYVYGNLIVKINKI